MSRNLTIAIVVALILVVAGWLLTRPKQTSVSESAQPASTSASNESTSSSANWTFAPNLITITKSGFSPKDLTIKTGETVDWTNADIVDHTVNSAPHPTHTAYPPLNLDTIKPGDKKSLNFPEPGTYKYHDHLNPSLVGSIIVE